MSKGRRVPAGLLGLLLVLLVPVVLAPRCGAGGGAQNDHVLVVVNANAPISVAIGEYYRSSRNIPVGNVLSLSIPLSDPSLSTPQEQLISRNNFVQKIRDPIIDYLVLNDLQDQIQIIVTTKGIPYRIAGTGNSFQTWDRASVESELTLLFSGLDGAQSALPNPYFESDLTFEEFRAANPASPLRYLVARLDASQENVDPGTGVPADVKSLIDGAFGVLGAGTWLIDEDPTATPQSGYVAGNIVLLESAAAVLEAIGLDVTHDTTAVFQSDVSSLRGYASWGSNDANDPGAPYYGLIGGNLFPGTFAPRAVSVDIVSSNGTSFTTPFDYLSPNNFSRVADLIHLGLSGAAAHAFEPLLAAAARPHIFFRYFAEGRPAGESFHRSIPYLSWQNFYVGDPLMTGWGAMLAPDDLDGDGIPDASDNCTDIPNADQRDTDSDGYGNLCDGDVNNSGTVTSLTSFPYGDLELIWLTWQYGPYDPDHDLDGDAVVNNTDLSLAQMRLLHPPGPSGLAP